MCDDAETNQEELLRLEIHKLREIMKLALEDLENGYLSYAKMLLRMELSP